MKEFSVSTQGAFTKGLRTYPKRSAKEAQFYLLENFKATDFGIVPFLETTNPFSSATLEAVGIEYTTEPLAQLFIGKMNSFLCNSDAGLASQGTVTFLLIPPDGSAVVLGTETYEFQDGVSGAFIIDIDQSLTNIIDDFVSSVNDDSSIATATRPVGTDTVLILADSVGIAPNSWVFTTDAGATKITVDGGGTFGGTVIGTAGPSIFTVNTSTWALTLIATYDAESVGNTKAITGNGLWHFVDMYDSWIFMNGTSVVFTTAQDRMLGNTVKAYTRNNISVTCGTYNRGRVMLGGFDETNFWDTIWETFWTASQKTVVDTGIDDTVSSVMMPVYENFVWFSTIGGGDVLMMLFPQLVIDGIVDTKRAAQGKGYLPTNPSDGDELVIGTETWYFVLGATSADDEVEIGVNSNATINNLVTEMTNHSLIASAVNSTGNYFTVTWDTKGVAGNSAVFTSDTTNSDLDGYGTLGGTTKGSDGYDDEYILDLIRRNEQGFAPMEVQGEVQVIKPLGEFNIVYSDYGVTAMKPVSTPISTYSIKKINDLGISSRVSVAGNDSGHVYVDNSGQVIRINPDTSFEVLGYSEYLFSHLDDIVVSHTPSPVNNDTFGEFHFGGDITNSFLLTKNGFSKYKGFQSRCEYFAGATVGIRTELSSDIGKLGIDLVDFSLSGLKSLEWVQVVGVESTTRTLSVTINYRYTSTESWKTTSSKTLNNEGMVFFPVSGLEFRVNLQVTDYANMEIEYVRISYKHGDKRYTRDISVGEANA